MNNNVCITILFGHADAGEIETPLTVNSEYWEFEDEIMKVELDGSHEIQVSCYYSNNNYRYLRNHTMNR